MRKSYLDYVKTYLQERQGEHNKMTWKEAMKLASVSYQADKHYIRSITPRRRNSWIDFLSHFCKLHPKASVPQLAKEASRVYRKLKVSGAFHSYSDQQDVRTTGDVHRDVEKEAERIRALGRVTLREKKNKKYGYGVWRCFRHEKESRGRVVITRPTETNSAAKLIAKRNMVL